MIELLEPALQAAAQTLRVDSPVYVGGIPQELRDSYSPGTLKQEYLYRFIAFHEGGSVSSDWSQGRTTGTAPQRVPTPSRAQSINGYSIEVAWDEPAVAKGVREKYILKAYRSRARIENSVLCLFSPFARLHRARGPRRMTYRVRHAGGEGLESQLVDVEVAVLHQHHNHFIRWLCLLWGQIFGSAFHCMGFSSPSSQNPMTPSDLDPAGGTVVSRNGFPLAPLPPAESCPLFFAMVLSSAPPSLWCEELTKPVASNFFGIEMTETPTLTEKQALIKILRHTERTASLPELCSDSDGLFSGRLCRELTGIEHPHSTRSLPKHANGIITEYSLDMDEKLVYTGKEQNYTITDSLGSSSGEHPEETGKEKGADQMGRQVRGTYRPQSVSGSGPPLEGRLVTQAKFCLQLGFQVGRTHIRMIDIKGTFARISCPCVPELVVVRVNISSSYANNTTEVRYRTLTKKWDLGSWSLLVIELDEKKIGEKPFGIGTENLSCMILAEQGQADNVKPCSEWPVCLCLQHSMWMWDLTIQITPRHVTKKPNSVRSRFSKANSEVHTVSKIAVHMKTMNRLDCLGATKIKQKLLKCWVSSGVLTLDSKAARPVNMHPASLGSNLDRNLTHPYRFATGICEAMLPFLEFQPSRCSRLHDLFSALLVALTSFDLDLMLFN
ncbi:hypothetical protein ACRRTK_005176 [Alexandromys fortis]